MTQIITLQGDGVKAVFSFAHGFNLTSFSKGSREGIAGGKEGFIGPRFKRGVGSSAPWVVEQNEHQFIAHQDGKQEWDGKLLKDLEGQGFKTKITGSFEGEKLHLHLSIVSDTDSLVGPVFRIPFDFSKDRLHLNTKEHYYRDGILTKIPDEWKTGEFSKFADDFAIGIRPAHHSLHNSLVFENQSIEVGYHCQCEESSFYLFREKGEPWMGVSPVSSQNPWKPNLTVSSISATIRFI